VEGCEGCDGCAFAFAFAFAFVSVRAVDRFKLTPADAPVAFAVAFAFVEFWTFVAVVVALPEPVAAVELESFASLFASEPPHEKPVDGAAVVVDAAAAEFESLFASLLLFSEPPHENPVDAAAVVVFELSAAAVVDVPVPVALPNDADHGLLVLAPAAAVSVLSLSLSLASLLPPPHEKSVDAVVAAGSLAAVVVVVDAPTLPLPPPHEKPVLAGAVSCFFSSAGLAVVELPHENPPVELAAAVVAVEFVVAVAEEAHGLDVAAELEVLSLVVLNEKADWLAALGASLEVPPKEKVLAVSLAAPELPPKLKADWEALSVAEDEAAAQGLEAAGLSFLSSLFEPPKLHGLELPPLPPPLLASLEPPQLNDIAMCWCDQIGNRVHVLFDHARNLLFYE